MAIMVLTDHASISSRMLPILFFLLIFYILLCVSIFILLSIGQSFKEKLVQNVKSLSDFSDFVFVLEMFDLLSILVALSSLFLLNTQLQFRAFALTAVLLVWLALTHILVMVLLINLVPFSDQIKTLNKNVWFPIFFLILFVFSTVAITNFPSFMIDHFFQKFIKNMTSIRVYFAIVITQFFFFCTLSILIFNKFFQRIKLFINRAAVRLSINPFVTSLAIAIIFFIVVFVFFYPAYGSYDDTSLVSLLNGYFDGQIQPLLVYSNVLLGLLLVPAVRLFPSINWLIIFEITVQFFSLWSLIFISLVIPNKHYLKWAGILALLLFELYFLTSITYTTTAAFASIAGICLIVAAIRWSLKSVHLSLACGSILILTASLIRLEPVLLIIGVASPLILLILISCNWRKWLPIGLITATLLGSAFLFDHFYYLNYPGWNQYRAYNNIRMSIHDTPRFQNIVSNTSALEEIQWSQNDVWLFQNWFFPDEQVYSYNNLKYLSEATPVQRGNLSTILTFFQERLFSPLVVPYFIIFLTIWSVVLFQAQRNITKFCAWGLLIVFFSVNLYMCWVMKLPYRILIPTLAATTIFSAFIPDWYIRSTFELSKDENNNHRFIIIFLSVFMALSMFSVLFETVSSSIENRLRRNVYHQICSDVAALQTKGVISDRSVFISNGVGIPWEWSDPLIIDFPTSYQYLVANWLAFSPPYQTVQNEYGLQSIFDALYKKPNVYLVTRPDLIAHITQFIKEKRGVNVTAIDLYTLPTDGLDENYTDTHIYKLVPATQP